MSVVLNRVGHLDLTGLDAISERRGRDFMPHPFTHTQPSRFTDYDEYAAYASDVCDRVNRGDLHPLRRWFDSYVNADLRVECVVSMLTAPKRRLLAHRSGEFGFLAAQRTDEDVVDVDALSPYELGPAIAQSVPLSAPGAHPKIVIPGLIRRSTPTMDTVDDDRYLIRHRVEVPDAVSVSRAKLAKYTRVQSRWQPARDWGFDRDKNIVVWVQISDDGDYIYSPDFSYLTPVTIQSLGRRIDKLIAEDVVAVRESRRL